MHRFVRTPADYPNVMIGYDLQFVDAEVPELRVLVSLDGPEDHRKRWRSDFESWCQSNKLPAQRGKARATKGFSHIELQISGLTPIAEFVIRWIGLDWLKRADWRSRDIDNQTLSEVRELREQIDIVTRKLTSLHKIFNERSL